MASPNETRSGGAAAGLILAAGRGTRLTTASDPLTPKVMRPLLGKPMIEFVLRTLRDAGVERVAIVVGFGADQITGKLGAGYDYVLQPEQKGSGDAVACARDYFRGFDGALVVMCGDSPLFRSETLSGMLRCHWQEQASATLAAARPNDPTGYGRILRSGSGEITGVVEQACASEDERKITEVNGGAYVFDAQWLFGNIGLMRQNSAKEYNLTDMVRVAVEQGRRVSSVPCEPEEIAGVNTPEDLRAVEAILHSRGVK